MGSLTVNLSPVDQNASPFSRRRHNPSLRMHFSEWSTLRRSLDGATDAEWLRRPQRITMTPSCVMLGRPGTAGSARAAVHEMSSMWAIVTRWLPDFVGAVTVNTTL